MTAATRFLARAVLLAAAGMAAGDAQARQTATPFATGQSGYAVFRTYCASCHGLRARGDGPLAESLRSRPPDLTLLAKRNGGKFDAETVHRIIDGRDPVKGHGGGDMPVWGDAFLRSEGQTEERVKTRIEALVAYLRAIQQK